MGLVSLFNSCQHYRDFCICRVYGRLEIETGTTVANNDAFRGPETGTQGIMP